MDPWWTVQQAGWIGGSLGATLGLLGGAFGMTAGFLAPKGKGKVAVLSLIGVILGLGVLSLVAGIVALIASQPYHVYYPLLLIGGIGSIVAGVNLPVILARYRQAEARRLDAAELRRT